MKKFYFWSIVFIFLFSFNLLADTILSEDFEGSVSGWTFGTTGEPNRWFCGTATSHNGNKSAYISNDNGATASYQKTASSTSWLEKSVDLSGYSSATLTFYWKCIGQTGTINRDYGEARFYVDSGLRTFKWSYKKNGSVSQGKDAAWLDCICFPPFISAHPDAPSNLTITIDNNNVILSWDRVDSAIQYNIYRSENPTTGFVLYDTSSVTSYIDQGAVADAKNYFYYITTVNSAR